MPGPGAGPFALSTSCCCAARSGLCAPAGVCCAVTGWCGWVALQSFACSSGQTGENHTVEPSITVLLSEGRMSEVPESLEAIPSVFWHFPEIREGKCALARDREAEVQRGSVASLTSNTGGSRGAGSRGPRAPTCPQSPRTSIPARPLPESSPRAAGHAHCPPNSTARTPAQHAPSTCKTLALPSGADAPAQAHVGGHLSSARAVTIHINPQSSFDVRCK